MKKILLRYYSRLNFGDDLFVKLFSEYFENFEIHLLCNPLYYPSNLGKHVKVSAWSWIAAFIGKLQGLAGSSGRLQKFLVHIYDKVISAAGYGKDACVLIGGSLFMDSREANGGRQEIDFSVPVSRKREFSKCVVNRSHNRMFLICANLGPAYHANYFQWVGKFFDAYASVTLRDYASYLPFESDPHVRYAPDVGFLLKPDENAVAGGYAVISVIDVSRHTADASVIDAYFALLTETANAFLDRGYEIAVVSLCAQEGDEAAADRLCNAISSNGNVKRFSYDGDVDRILNVFSSASMVVASRFHSMIIGFVFDKPVFPISYNCKTLHYL